MLKLNPIIAHLDAEYATFPEKAFKPERKKKFAIRKRGICFLKWLPYLLKMSAVYLLHFTVVRVVTHTIR